MSEKQAMKCHYCDKTRDLRPYGPRGAMVCFGCATSTPQREAEAKRNFLTQLDACGPVAMIDGSDAGPYPAKHYAPQELQQGHGWPVGSAAARIKTQVDQ